MGYPGKADGRDYFLLPRALADPTPLSQNGKLYSKVVAGVTQLFFQADDGTLYQMTPPPVGDAGGFVGGQAELASYTFVLDDKGKLVTISNAGAVTATIPPNATEAFPLWTVLSVLQEGAGQVTFVAGVGVTVRSGLTAKTRAQYSVIAAVQTSLDVWTVYGDMASS